MGIKSCFSIGTLRAPLEPSSAPSSGQHSAASPTTLPTRVSTSRQLPALQLPPSPPPIPKQPQAKKKVSLRKRITKTLSSAGIHHLLSTHSHTYAITSPKRTSTSSTSSLSGVTRPSAGRTTSWKGRGMMPERYDEHGRLIEGGVSWSEELEGCWAVGRGRWLMELQEKKVETGG